MPSGRTHEIINLATFAALGGAYTLAYTQGYVTPYEAVLTPEVLSAFCVSYLVGTFFVTPDLDLAENSNVRAKQHWGFLGWLWVPYGKMFSHRGMSHSWFIGPLTRILYLLIVIVLVASLIAYLLPYFGYRLNLEAELRENWRELLLGALLGYYLSQWLHLIADGVRPDHGIKRSRRRRKRRKRRK